MVVESSRREEKKGKKTKDILIIWLELETFAESKMVDSSTWEQEKQKGKEIVGKKGGNRKKVAQNVSCDMQECVNTV